MVHVAYDIKELVRNCPVKIESLALFGSRLLLASIDGSLRVYAPHVDDDDDDDDEEEEAAAILAKSLPLKLHSSIIGFARKPVSSMDVSPSRNLLFTLSDALTIYHFPTLDVAAYLSKTKGASLFSWDETLGLLCSAKQKRLTIFQHDGARDFSELKELTAPDVVKSMAWSGDSLCLGIRREYIIMNTVTGASIEVFPCGGLVAPFVVPLPNGELLLGKDNVGVFIDQNGKSTHPVGIAWSEAPGFVVVHPPYVLARLSRFIEVRYLKAPHSLVQMLPLREMQLLSSSGGMVASGPLVLVASDAAVYGLFPVPLGVQIVQLSASRSFEEALMLCKLLPPQDAALRAAKEDDIHIRYGQMLFEDGEYSQAMQHFAQSSLDLESILGLFASIKLPRFHISNASSTSLEMPSGEDIALAEADPEHFDSNEGSTQDQEQGEEIEKDTKSFHDRQKSMAFSALAGFLMAKRAAITEKAEAEDTAAAVAAIVEDEPTSRAASDLKRTKSTSKYGDSEIGKGMKHSARDLATLLDTALLQALLHSQQFSAAMELLKGVNYVDVEACEGMLVEGGHYRELLQLYQYNGMHGKVINLLNRLVLESDSMPAASTEAEKLGPEAIIDYLRKLGGQDPSLILESSTWLLKNFPEKAMDLFTSLDPPLPANVVYSYIKEQAPNLQAMYLEHLMTNDPKSLSPQLHNELVRIYLDRVLEERAELQSQGKFNELEHTEIRKKFLRLLENAAGYNLESLMKRLPTNGLHDERALLLGQMGQHQLALTLYAHKLHQPELALKYCDRVFLESSQTSFSRELAVKHSADKGAANIYLTLLHVYLNPTLAIREYDRAIAGVTYTRSMASHRTGSAYRAKGHVARKIAQIEGAEDNKQSLSSNESTADSGKSDAEDVVERGNQSENILLNEALHLLRCRWDRIDGAQALRLLPSETKLKHLLPFLEPLLRKSTETRRNLSVIRSLRRSENIQVRNELHQCRRRVIKVTSESACSICHKRIGGSVFAVYPNGTLVHFVCHRDKGLKASPSPITSV